MIEWGYKIGGIGPTSILDEGFIFLRRNEYLDKHT